jgi:hypothetical protein
MTTKKENTVIRKRGDVVTRLIPRKDERARALDSARKENPFFAKAKGELDPEKVINKVLREGLNCAKLFDSVAQYFSDSKSLKCQEFLGKVYPCLNQTRSFQARFKSHFSSGDKETRARRRITVSLDDCLVD